MADLSEMLGEWRTERTKLQDLLEREATAPAGMTAERRVERAIAELKHLQRLLKTSNPAKVRAVLKSLIEDIRLWFEPYGKQKRLAKGQISFSNNLQLMATDSRAR
jgi:hypothetical protein